MLPNTKLVYHKYNWLLQTIDDNKYDLYKIDFYNIDDIEIIEWNVEVYINDRIFILNHLYEIKNQNKKFRRQMYNLQKKFKKEKRNIQSKEYRKILSNILCYDICGVILEFIV